MASDVGQHGEVDPWQVVLGSLWHWYTIEYQQRLIEAAKWTSLTQVLECSRSYVLSCVNGHGNHQRSY